MLVLKLRLGQAIQIGSDVTVKLVRSHGPDDIIIGIEAPLSRSVTRVSAKAENSVAPTRKPRALSFGQAAGLDGT